MKRVYSRLAFTMIEVVVALGLLAASVMFTVSLQNSIHSTLTGISESNRAAQLVDAVLVELRRLRDQPDPGGQNGLDALAGLIASSQDRATLRLIGARDGTRVIRESDLATASLGIEPAERFYLVEVRQQPEPLNYVRDAGFLALALTISWPYSSTEGPAAGISPRRISSLVFNTALTP